MSRQRLIILGIILAGALTGGGCGEETSNEMVVQEGRSSSDVDVTTSSLDRTEYVAEANALCTEIRNETRAAVNAYVAQNMAKSREEALPEVRRGIYVPAMEERLVELRALGAPQGEEDRIAGMLAVYDKAIEETAALGAATTSDVLNGYLDRFGRIARKYGLIECTYG